MTRTRARELVALCSRDLRALAGAGVLVVTDGAPPAVRAHQGPPPPTWPPEVRRALETPPAGPWRWLVAEGPSGVLAVPVTWPTVAPHLRGAA